MICLGQGGLRSLSASSYKCHFVLLHIKMFSNSGSFLIELSSLHVKVECIIKIYLFCILVTISNVSGYSSLFNYLLGKGGYVFGSVCLFVCGQHYSKSDEQIGIKFYGEVLGSTMKN